MQGPAPRPYQPTGDTGVIMPGDVTGMGPGWAPLEGIQGPSAVAPGFGTQGYVPAIPEAAGLEETWVGGPLIHYKACPMTVIPDAVEQIHHRDQCRELRRAINDAGMAYRGDPPLLELIATGLRSLPAIDRPSQAHMMDVLEAFQQLTFWSVDARGVWAWLLNSGWDLLSAVRAYTHRRWGADGAPESEVSPLASGEEEEDEDEDEVEYVDEDPENIGDIPEDIETETYVVPDTRKRVRAVRHGDIRSYLIEQAAAEGEYVYGREQHPQDDDLTDDKTSFLAAHKHWGFKDRAQYPPIVFVFEGKHRDPPTFPVPEMRWRGLLVLDHAGVPVRRFPNIPATLSTQLEGGLMEAMQRADPRIHSSNFLARMPTAWTETLVGGAATKRHAMSANVLASRMMRFRENAACLNWGGRRENWKPYDRWLRENLPAPLEHANSTRGLLRNPTKWEVQQMKDSNRLAHVIVPLQLRQEFPFGRDGGSMFHPADEHDCRDCVPDSRRDRAALDDALLLTVMHFIEVTGKCPRVPLEGYRTYRQLLEVVEGQYDEEVAGRRRRGAGGPGPLKQLGRWTGGVARWRAARVLNR
ncbi:MAG: hypothetical protein LQ344_007160 [Seirophora lacunosa]|nr:MAG: hypothetical protein LQ344_007160 [Seirophora lacunosa]